MEEHQAFSSATLARFGG